MALERLFRRKRPSGGNRDVPELWTKCEACGAQIYKKEFQENLHVCPKCGHHHRLPARERVAMLADPGTFQEITRLRPLDPLGFVDTKPYVERLKAYQAETGRPDAILGGTCQIGGVPAVLLVMDYAFAGGSMGSVVGEEIARGAERAAEEGRALVIVAASGGARMQEAALSLMQMAKTVMSLDRVWARRLPYVSVLTDPTTGGVTASFAALADVIFAEPGALIGFAGPRVIRQTIRQELPEGFQRSEFLLKHGMVDRVTDRRRLKEELVRVLRHLHPGVAYAPGV
ncbi:MULTISPECIES: acetyl-CoA carboxylase, carboxyltransferase subunit beta [Thermus]|jgi:acetyl-CoA carboxylase carboxyl transferase subunit beta|uniref:Acetyl-coenzyme A carboxylase carboxyl transferase subunit beta n=1 Tax=Thermus thermophilus (strain ATCC 27634 / DSM 579 / HB8) TaxID=300852 RepID=ACCD_THET8|nr:MULTISPECIES: acetyl-CoA carboxylase, carboxyltransferase subunit beta [Thermus]Q5SHG2.1 RecName: Full=Acetyl-coenzyme A carboxylase carboxyl transferase subunit beta; Short=ACCase subunit beta; Short=Acetyl-CoA carboxylase carboxyltransferase subunit beta [Thermus thermophilus HB8]QZY58338.1 acetyl-CoA carboxylase, carboxyltransferase subunit beta [Thermus thermophilus]BAD71591.1 acetyl-CoA carboxylase carboxyl transferase, beta subunit (AccD) [Thermus thermophilus HB8]BDA38385.1 acetyl-coe